MIRPVTRITVIPRLWRTLHLGFAYHRRKFLEAQLATHQLFHEPEDCRMKDHHIEGLAAQQQHSVLVASTLTAKLPQLRILLAVAVDCAVERRQFFGG